MFIHSDVVTFPRLTQCNLPTGRVYKVDEGPQIGAVYPSITRVLGHKPKPQLEKWKKRVGAEEAARVSARATVQGTAVHKLAECYVSNQDLPKSMPHVMELWQPLRNWMHAHITTVYAQEQNVYSEKLGVAGRLDFLVDVDYGLTVADVKTSAKPKLEEYVRDYFLQGTFYSLAVYEHTGYIPKRIVLPITSPEGFEIFECKPSTHFEELVCRIRDFYLSYTTETV